MKASGLMSPRPLNQLIRPGLALRVLVASCALTVIVTLLSLAELSRLISQGNPGSDRLDWREVAGRAVKHAETLPHLAHLHHQSGQAAGGASQGACI